MVQRVNQSNLTIYARQSLIFSIAYLALVEENGGAFPPLKRYSDM